MIPLRNDNTKIIYYNIRTIIVVKIFRKSKTNLLLTFTIAGTGKQDVDSFNLINCMIIKYYLKDNK